MGGPFSPGEPPAAGAVGTLAARVDRLFRTFLRPDGREFSYDQVATAIGSGGGPTISANYLYLLRRGLRDNPTKRHIEALAAFFKVPPAYFFDDDLAQQVERELDLLMAIRSSGVQGIALRAAGLSAETLEAVHHMIENARRIEGLPPAPVLQAQEDRP